MNNVISVGKPYRQKFGRGSAYDIIDTNIKNAIDQAIFALEEKGYEFSPATTSVLVNKTIKFIKDMAQTIESQELVEPEAYDDAMTENPGWK